MIGSPPHARGRREWTLAVPEPAGITPACAGKTHSGVVHCLLLRDHPRMRGEDSNCHSATQGQQGSPPHARGRQPHPDRPPFYRRITPACAGKTVGCQRSRCYPRDHPRMRGEDCTFPRTFVYQSGSPPHARGRLNLESSPCIGAGITPACAGKTVWSIVLRVMYPDHPRMRGEDPKYQLPHGEGSGSPPHARGRPAPGQQRANLARITPACAGKTSPSTWTCSRRPDHPRMRGEDTPLRELARAATGSPPHARGRHVAHVSLVCFGGITPACAGKTLFRHQQDNPGADHPRMRGEDMGVLQGWTNAAWITPACAGKTLTS